MNTTWLWVKSSCEHGSSNCTEICTPPQTYNVNHQVTDSAAAAVAMFAGEKVNYGTLGVNSNVVRYDCQATKGNEIDTITKWSQDEGECTWY